MIQIKRQEESSDRQSLVDYLYLIENIRIEARDVKDLTIPVTNHIRNMVRVLYKHCNIDPAGILNVVEQELKSFMVSRFQKQANVRIDGFAAFECLFSIFSLLFCNFNKIKSASCNRIELVNNPFGKDEQSMQLRLFDLIMNCFIVFSDSDEKPQFFRPSSPHILFCSSNVDERNLANFFKRVRSFSADRFVILGVEQLNPILIEFFLNQIKQLSKAAEYGYLSIILKNSQLFSCFPWISKREIRPKPVSAELFSQLFNMAGALRHRIPNMKVFVGPEGSGKTRLFSSARPISIPLNDRINYSIITSRLRKTRTITSSSSSSSKVHFNITREDAFFEEIDLFFFQLLVCGSVSDSIGNFYSLPENTTDIYVELISPVVIENGTPSDFIQKKFPVLSCLVDRKQIHHIIDQRLEDPENRSIKHLERRLGIKNLQDQLTQTGNWNIRKLAMLATDLSCKIGSSNDSKFLQQKLNEAKDLLNIDLRRLVTAHLNPILIKSTFEDGGFYIVGLNDSPPADTNWKIVDDIQIILSKRM